MNKKDFCISWRVTLIAMITVIASSFTINVQNTNHYYLSMFVGEFMMIIPIICGIIPLIKRKTLGDKVFCKIPPKIFIIAVLLPVCAQPFINIFTLPINAVTTFLFDTGADTSLPEAVGVSEKIFKALTLVVVAPMFEEILCRGILMQYLKKYGIWVSLIVSSLSFALLHFDPTTLVVIFFVGMILGIVKTLTGSLAVSIAAHAVNNLVAMTEFPATVSYVIFGASIIAFPVLLYLFMKFLPEEARERLKLREHDKPEFSLGAIFSFSLYGFFALILVIMKIGNFFMESKFLF